MCSEKKMRCDWLCKWCGSEKKLRCDWIWKWCVVRRRWDVLDNVNDV